MENTNHVKNYFWIKIFFIPILLPYFIISGCYYLFHSYKYLKKNTDLDFLARYKKFSKFYSNMSFFFNYQYIFTNEKNLTKSPTLFICQNSINWSHLYLGIYFLKTELHYPISFYIQEKNKKWWNSFSSLIDNFYYLENLNFFNKKKRSIFFCIQNIDELKKILDNGCLTITLVNIKQQKIFLGKKIYIDFFHTIKSSESLKFTKINFLNQISNLIKSQKS